MAIKKITLTQRQNFGGVWYEPGDYTRATFLGERYADGDEAMAEKMWDKFVYKASRHSDCPAIKIETDKPAQAARPITFPPRYVRLLEGLMAKYAATGKV